MNRNETKLENQLLGGLGSIHEHGHVSGAEGFQA